MPKKEKIEQVASFQSELENKALIFVNYDGINVTSLTEIREELREGGNRLKVFRNTLLKRALSNLKTEVSDENLLTGMTATAIFDNETFLGSSKSLIKAEQAATIAIKGGVFQGEVITAELVRKYATMPSREGLLSLLVGALGGVLSNFAFVLEEVKKQKEAAAPEAAASAPEAEAKPAPVAEKAEAPAEEKAK